MDRFTKWKLVFFEMVFFLISITKSWCLKLVVVFFPSVRLKFQFSFLGRYQILFFWGKKDERMKKKFKTNIYSFYLNQSIFKFINKLFWHKQQWAWERIFVFEQEFDQVPCVIIIINVFIKLRFFHNKKTYLFYREYSHDRFDYDFSTIIKLIWLLSNNNENKTKNRKPNSFSSEKEFGISDAHTYAHNFVCENVFFCLFVVHYIHHPNINQNRKKTKNY